MGSVFREDAIKQNDAYFLRAVSEEEVAANNSVAVTFQSLKKNYRRCQNGI